jgi:hypothetical protein
MSFISTLFGCSKRDENVIPPVDLDKPVENPKILTALNNAADSGHADAVHQVTKEVNHANFLIPILADQMATKPGKESGQAVVEKDSRISFLLCADESGGNLLPLFTDWPSIKSWTTQQVSTLVMPSKEAWNFMLSHKEYSGAIVNPAGPSLKLPRSLIQKLNAE